MEGLVFRSFHILHEIVTVMVFMVVVVAVVEQNDYSFALASSLTTNPT
jgi:hypothetical protein